MRSFYDGCEKTVTEHMEILMPITLMAQVEQTISRIARVADLKLTITVENTEILTKFALEDQMRTI